MDEYEKSIRRKVFDSGILTDGEWVYLVGTFQTASEIDETQKAVKEALAFLNKIEGAGYGGMADFEIARHSLRMACG